jgi:hypothetical protein
MSALGTQVRIQRPGLEISGYACRDEEALAVDTTLRRLSRLGRQRKYRGVKVFGIILPRRALPSESELVE